jgi:hypothetical protein
MSGGIVYFGAKRLRTWPKEQRIDALDEPSVRLTDFSDSAVYHPRLIEKIHALEQEGEIRDTLFKGGCGVKIRHMDRWNSIEADLVSARARMLFCTVMGTPSAVIDSSWASVYRAGDFCMPHSHPRATAGILYMLDPGDHDPENELAGKFYFADPRIASCCQLQAGCLTNLLMPDLRAGSMLIFPGQFVHGVNPYSGGRPRITLSWNLNAQALAGSSQNPWKGAR